MRTILPFVSLLAIAVPVAPASGALITMGSDLEAEAATSIDDERRIQQHGADTAFWPLAFPDGRAVEAPEDGQIVKVTIKGTVFREEGASMPANLIHFQSLEPAAADGSRRVLHSSGNYYLPVDRPNAISTYEPENLCIPKGGTWDFNNVGGHMFAGSYDYGVTDPNHYIGGARFGVFGLVDGSTTAQYTASDKTKNGDTLHPQTQNQQIDFPYGNRLRGIELLMQVVIATGNDRSEPCGGPRRHPDGTLVDVTPDANYLKVASAGGRAQQPYVTKDRRFQVGVYCGGQTAQSCNGTATLMVGRRLVARGSFAIPVMKTGRIAMRLSRPAFRRLDGARARRLKTTLVIDADVGDYTFPLTLKR